jgi:PAS domain S-box-containing protein
MSHEIIKIENIKHIKKSYKSYSTHHSERSPMYRLLYVDDEPDLLEIGKIFLEQSGQFIVDTAISAPAALVLLSSTSYDAIIADYQMPEMDGIEFLKTIRSSGNTIPFILFTGRGREEVVIQALNEGADFYLHKGGEPRSQFAELSNKVYYAVMRRRAEESLKQNEAQLRQIIDLVPHMIFANDWNGNFLLVNRALAQSYNTTAADLVGKSLTHLHSDAAGLQHMLDDNREVMTTGTIKFIPNEPYIDPSGNHRILQTTKVPFTTLGNNQQAVLGIAIDITERKESEMELRGAYEQIIAQEVELRGQYEAMVSLQQRTSESQRVLSSIIDFLPDATFAIDTSGKVISWNKAIETMTGIQKKDILGKGDFCYALPFYGKKRPMLINLILHFDETFATETYSYVKRVGETLFSEAYVPRMREETGTHLWFTASPLYSKDGVLAGAIESIRDITQFKRTEQALRESEERYRRIVETTDEGIVQLDETFKIVYINPRMAEMLGYTPEEVIGRDLTSFMAAEEIPGIISRFNERMRGKSGHYQCRFLTKDGKIRWLQISATPLLDSDSTFQGSFAMCSDITDRKTAEIEIARRNEELHTAYEQLTTTKKELQKNYDELAKSQKLLEESEKKYRDIVEDQTEFISRFLPDGTHVFVNDAYCRYFGLKREEILGRRFQPPVPAEDGLRIKEALASLTPEYPVTFIRQRVIFPDGNVRWQRWSDRAIYDDAGNLVEYQSVGRDITDVITAEQALLESEQRYRNVVENQTEFICRFLPDGTHVFVNDAYCRYFGLKRDEIVGHRFRPRIPVEDQERVKRFFAALTSDHPINTIEHRIIMPDGILRWQRWSDRAIFDPSGTVIEYQSTGRDITEEKAMQTALVSSEIRFREQYQSNPLAIFTWQYRDDDFVLVDCNRAAKILSGGRSHDYLGVIASEFYATRPELIAEIRQCFSKQTVISKELVSEHFLPGRLIHTTAAFVPPDLIMVHMEDITERKEAEEALRESQRVLAEAMDLANLVTWECDLRTGILTFDDRFSTLYGTTAEQKSINHMTAAAYLQDIVHPEDRGILDEEDENNRKTTDPHYVSKREYRIIRRDGEIRHIEMCVGITKDAEGRTIKTYGVNQDITERKKTEEALRRANRQLSLLSGITRHDIINKITGILGYLQLTEMKSTDPVIDSYLGTMESAIMEIRSQIDFTRIYQDLGTNAPQWIELDKVMPRLHVLLTVSLNTDVQGVEVFADPMLEKIFTNLLDNSLRHGQRVTTIRVSSGQSHDDLVVVWEDDGIGIAADEKERIFERGFGKNNGLGLFLTREILSLTGITIQETGEPGKGARFEITVPKKQYRFTGSGKRR